MSTPSESDTYSSTYLENERVLCFHGPLIYEAKILKVAEGTEEEPPLYRVHYKGWKQSWDEWVDSKRLLKFTEQNLLLQESLKGNASSTGGKAGKPFGRHPGTSQKPPGTGKDTTRGTKRAREEDGKREIHLDLPEVLKEILIADWEMIVKYHRVIYVLTRTPNVGEILSEFGEYVINHNPYQLRDPALLLPTIISGLRIYFDRALVKLLYRFEHPHWSSVMDTYYRGRNAVAGKTDKEMSDVYGAEHLLRMLVKLPQMVTQYQPEMDNESLLIVQDYANALLQWMAQERDRLFARPEQYASCPPGYLKAAV